MISRKVMIVEDDPLLSIVEKKLVTKLGYEVVGMARSGEEVLGIIADINPSILLMDIQLSGDLDGIETAKQLRSDQIDIPVIFLSGDDSPMVLNQAKDVDYIDFLLKPVTKSDLSNSLGKAENKINSKSQYAA
ncbi:MAG: response regulator [Gracilimonas sp.]|uniref:response regulator n=1 Tax=Gracilimonas TaxID=649462 RepID=UPI001B28B7FB|nr:response regulator [Gracilimonas sp.]MBO6585014.1 response regulator [Gracilimonas sp.]MBO6615715.1 response regulator [Gracilimonas sp.]